MKKVVIGVLIFMACFVLMRESAQAQVVATGECGDENSSLTWTYEDDDTLTIRGTGYMKNFGYFSRMPWYSYNRKTKHIVIEDGVKSICREAFCYFTVLEDVTIADSVETMGDAAFMACGMLSSYDC